MLPTIGIVGAGKVGITLAQLARKAGYEVLISGSSEASKIRLSVNVLAPGASALTTGEVAARADVIILALPLSQFKSLPRQELSGKIVIDAMNHWWETDGPREGIIEGDNTSSESVQEFLESSRVVKAFNHMGYHDLHDEARPDARNGRKAIAVAGNNSKDCRLVGDIINHMGFDPLYIGNLSMGKLLEPGNPAFGANLAVEALRELIVSTPR